MYLSLTNSNKIVFLMEGIFKELGKDKINAAILSIIGILSMIGVLYIQQYLRKQNIQLSDFGIFLRGTLPNFFAATGYCSLMFMWHRAYALNKGNYNIKRTLCIDFCITVLGLSLWELALFLIDGAPIDIYDIAMSFLGGILIVILIIILYRKDYNKAANLEY